MRGCSHHALHSGFLLRLVLGLMTCSAAHAASSRPVLDLQCVSFGKGPLLECSARLRAANGKPLEQAKVTLNASMPSMPMAHTIKPAAARATGEPGEYRGVLQLEMPGMWAIEVDISGPLRDRLVRRVRVEPCADKRRCPALETSAPRKP